MEAVSVWDASPAHRVALATAALLSVLVLVRAVPALYGLPAIGLLAAWGAPSGDARTTRSVLPVSRNLAIGSLVVIAFAVVAAQHRLLRPMIVTFGASLRGTLVSVAAIAVLALPLAMVESTTGDDLAPKGVVLTKRNLVLALTGLVSAATWHAGVGQSFVFLAVVVLILPVFAAASRPWYRRRDRLLRRFWRHPLEAGSGWHRLQVLNVLLVGALLGVAMFTGAFDVIRLYLPVGGYLAFQAAFFAGLAALVILACVPRSEVFLGTNVLLAAGSMFLSLQLMMIYLPPTEPVVLDSPLREEWYVSQGGHAELVNYHYVTSAQRDAVDIVQIVDGRSHPVGDTNLDSYYIFGDQLLAPADGSVTTVVDGLVDQPIGSVDREHEAGNHIVIEVSDGRYVLLAHIRQDSIQVAVGDRVSVGQVIGEVGNSGGSTEPHIHMQAFNLPSFDLARTDLAELLRVARTYPIVFQDVVLTRNGSTSTPMTVDPRRGDLMRPLP